MVTEFGLLDTRKGTMKQRMMIPRRLALLIAAVPCLLQASPLDLPVKEQRKLLEQKLFPLLAEADRVVIYSLYPVKRERLKADPDRLELVVAFQVQDEKAAAALTDADRQVMAFARKAPTFEGFPILGKAVMKQPDEIRGFLTSVCGAMLASAENEGEADCHDPRHAILVVKGEQRLRFSVCFACGNSYLRGAPESAADAVKVFHHFKSSLRDAFEAKFVEQGVPHAPYAKNPLKAPK